ncbi:DCC1-like thiol-disulfide oxidoreductase family protein [uncultured Kocuria sp.]|uniref:DCC1-like thiol-disulfide oxidoreductase family protein n=1 Tax=uncultured Kocuria sp. TaxID=259305 RepID=UPI002597EE8D|nr:DCC1-like thiol-disulfide oxidoreductase family protein [uncultured Kocuria sp.]
MRVFVYDDNCGPCVPLARLLARRTRGRLEVIPFSRVITELSEDDVERFTEEALYAAGTAPAPGTALPDAAHLWGHRAIAAGLAASHHRADRLLARIILAPGVTAVSQLAYRWFSRNRWRFGGGSCAVNPAGQTPTSPTR